MISTRSAAKQAVLPIGVLTLAIAVVVAFFRPLESAVLNWGELGVGFGRLLGLLVLPFVVTWVGVAAVALSFAVVAPTRVVALLVAVLTGLWVQGTFFVWDYGVFDGTPIDWSLHSGKGVVEACSWLLLLVLALVLPGFLARRALWVAAIVTGLQVVSLAGTLQLESPLAERGPAPESPASIDDANDRPIHESFMHFSATRNVVVVVVDTFQSDFFAELLQDPSFAAKVPPGFTYYRNAISPYTGTARSLPSILTSRTPDRRRTAGWMARQMERSVPAQLADRGWEAGVLSTTPHHLACNRARFDFACLSHVAFMASLESGGRSQAARERDDREDARTVFRVAVFRLAPHLLKPYVYRGGMWRVPDPWREDARHHAVDPRISEGTRRDLEILASLTLNAEIAGEKPTFKFIHLFGSHHPSSVAGDCAWNHEDVPTSVEGIFRSAYWERELAVAASGCIVSRVFGFLRRLDDLGVYDDSLVFVIADHGRQFSPVDLSLASPPIARAEVRAGKADGTRAGTLDQPTKGVPLFLVKPIGARSPLEISDTPVSLCDIPKSVFASLEIEHGFGCESIFEMRRDRTPRWHYRERSLLTQGGAEPSLLFSRYRVDGHSWLDESWVKDRSEPRRR